MDAASAQYSKGVALMAEIPHSVRPLDAVDRTILTALQEDGRMPNSELAQLAGIAPSTCVARVRSLVERGVISGFSAQVEPAALGWGIQALISVGVRSGARQHIVEFGDQIRALPQVVQVFFLGGSEDFIVHIAVPDSNSVRDFVLERLSANPIVATTRTSLVFDHHHSGVRLP
jgi:DNA-binding Lrp family transcriptional regulator